MLDFSAVFNIANHFSLLSASVRPPLLVFLLCCQTLLGLFLVPYLPPDLHTVECSKSLKQPSILFTLPYSPVVLNTIHTLMMSTFMSPALWPSPALSSSQPSVLWTQSFSCLLTYSQLPPLGSRPHDSRALGCLVVPTHSSVSSTLWVLINPH